MIGIVGLPKYPGYNGLVPLAIDRRSILGKNEPFVWEEEMKDIT